MAGDVLIVEDDDTLADNLRVYLERHRWRASVCASAEDGIAHIERRRPDVVLADLTLPGMSGLDFLRRVRGIDQRVRVVMLTASCSVQSAVDAMKFGAFDYLCKPMSLTDVRQVLVRAVGHSTTRAGDDPPSAGVGQIIGNSAATEAIRRKIVQIAEAELRLPADLLPAVLIIGETGTGKELVARALHAEGPRRDGPFVELNCAALPAHLLEAELFGYERGAFTDAKERKIGLVEAAEGGTLFLDEIGEIDVSLQAKLLHLLEDHSVRRLGSVQERKVNVRILSATNQDLEERVRAGQFRRDLYFRLRVIEICTPPLRERGGDILELADHYLHRLGERYGKTTLSFDAEAQALMLKHDWPGNVRELRNLVEHAVLMAEHPSIGPAQLPLGERQGAALSLEAPRIGAPGGESEVSQRERIVSVLDKTDWNISKSARLLGLSRDMLRYRIEKFGLARPD